MEIEDALEYEMYSSLWVKYISNDYLQTLAARYYVWKVRRKYKRYKRSVEIKPKK